MRIITIENRQAIPVRLIPFVTGWKFSPDVVARILAKEDKIYVVSITAFHLSPDGNYYEMLPKEWDVFVADIYALSDSIDAIEKTRNEHYAKWRSKSVECLPPSTFVWLSELEVAFNEAYSVERMDLLVERPGDRELNIAAYVKPNMHDLVFEGFAKQLSENSPELLKGNELYVRFKELHHFLILDPYYGVHSDKIESMIDKIYQINSENVLFLQFKNKFNLTLCRTDKQRHLIYLWCGLLGLNTFRKGSLLKWQWNDFLENWNRDFDINLTELNFFLEEHSWPLPVAFFPDKINAQKSNAKEKSHPLTIFHCMEKLQFSEIKIRLDPDNWMLKVSARGKNTTISMSDLKLMRKNQLTLDAQGIVFFELAKKEFDSSIKGRKRALTKLSKILRKAFKVNASPFVKYAPVFKLSIPKDIKAKIAGKKRAVKYDDNRSNSLDATQEFLENHDPDFDLNDPTYSIEPD